MIELLESRFFLKMLEFIGTYSAEKALDKIGKMHTDDIRADIELSKQLIEALNGALKSTCSNFNWEFDNTAIEETLVIDNSLWCNINNTENLSLILTNAIGHEFTEDVINFWLNSFKQQIAMHQKLFNYLCLLQEDNVSTNSTTNLKKVLWEASQKYFKQLCKKGNRFHSINIIEQLLPNGYITNNAFISIGKTIDGTEEALFNLCSSIDNDIVIVGDGGIGKTTFLQQLLRNAFLDSTGKKSVYKKEYSVPFFIELNNCPEHIMNWYDSSLKKTNFITRFIGQMVENHRSLDTVSHDTLDKIEKELQKIPENGNPEYLLLLDGFNEVNTSKSIRHFLSKEISVLHQYPNVKIITTSRQTQSAHFATEFTNIYLIGLSEKTIISYLENSKIPQPLIGNIMCRKPLVDCLKIPLYLCMFTAVDINSDFLPETAGEILYNFFHSNKKSYNVRRRAEETKSNALSEEQTAFVLDFIIPFIGWLLESENKFYINAADFNNKIIEGMNHTKELFMQCDINAFSYYNYSKEDIENILNSLYLSSGKINVNVIISCMYDHLGIIYKHKVSEGDFNDRIRFSFCHQHFRDYFSAIWDIQLLSMLKCISKDIYFNENNKESSYNIFLNSRYWQPQKVCFISEILMEHRNKPILNTLTNNWTIPKNSNDNQTVLTNALDFCRKLSEEKYDIKHLLGNILSTIVEGRKELSGVNLSNLNLKGCSLFNINCSKKGATNFLISKINNSILTEENFVPENHVNNIIEYVYYGRHCFTIDDAGLIKCWDVLSGKLEYELQSEEPLGSYDFSNKGYLKISNDGKFLAVKVQTSSPEGHIVYINVFNLNNHNEKPNMMLPTGKHKTLSFFGFTEDSKSIIALCDQKEIYCINLSDGIVEYHQSLQLLSTSEIYTQDKKSPLYVFTTEYNPYINEEILLSDSDYEDDSGDTIETPLCQIKKINPLNKENIVLYEFNSSPYTIPTVTYIPEKNTFLFFNYDSENIEKLNCNTNQIHSILNELTITNDNPPCAIHVCKDNHGECFVMFHDCCYLVDIDSCVYGEVLMKYYASNIEKLLPNTDQSGELIFKTNVAPINNKFIVSNDTNTYEWDSENDTLELKYNCVYYECVTMFPINKNNEFALIHANNGISVFGGNPIKLQNHVCFSDRDYFIGNCCYNEQTDLIAITFVRPDHEKVMIMNLNTGEQEYVFSSLCKHESVESLCFSDNGQYLLIATQYKCMEFCVYNKSSFIVVESEDNERIGATRYINEEIEVLFVEDSAVSTPRVCSRCSYYKRQELNEKIQYDLVWYYLLPTLDEKLYSFFIYRNGYFGIEESKNEQQIQTNWVTSGFFLEELECLKNILYPTCFKNINGTFTKINKQFNKFDMIYVKHFSPLSNSYRTQYLEGSKHGKYSYMYLSLDKNEAVFTEENERLFYINNLKALTYNGLHNGFKDNIGDENGNAYWDFAIPWSDNEIIGCFESYRLATVDLNTGRLGQEIKYYPGVSICKCCFDNTQIDEAVSDIIKFNGNLQ